MSCSVSPNSVSLRHLTRLAYDIIFDLEPIPYQTLTQLLRSMDVNYTRASVLSVPPCLWLILALGIALLLSPDQGIL